MHEPTVSSESRDPPAAPPGGPSRHSPQISELLSGGLSVEPVVISLDWELRIRAFTRGARRLYAISPEALGRPLEDVPHFLVDTAPLPPPAQGPPTASRPGSARSDVGGPTDRAAPRAALGESHSVVLVEAIAGERYIRCLVFVDTPGAPSGISPSLAFVEVTDVERLLVLELARLLRSLPLRLRVLLARASARRRSRRGESEVEMSRPLPVRRIGDVATESEGASKSPFAAPAGSNEPQEAGTELDKPRVGYEELWDRVPVILWSAGPDGRVRTANEAWKKVTGQSPAEAVGDGWLAAVAGEDRPACIEAWRRAVASGTPVELEARLAGPVPRSSRWFKLVAAPVSTEAGDIAGWSCAWTDIHDRKIADQSCRDCNQRLDDFERRVNEFLSVLGHELRNPLAAIVSGLELLQRVKEDSARFDWTISMMNERTERLAGVLDDLLHLVRILSGRVHLEREPFRLGRLVEHAAAATATLFESRRQTLRCRVTAELELFADPVRLEQVLVQLLTNASNFGREGGTVELNASRDATGTAAVLVVRDDGPGLPMEARERIFEPFARDRDDHYVDQGLGLGLAIAKRISELHGGDIQVREGPGGRGSEFVVRIPLGDRPKTGSKTASSSSRRNAERAAQARARATAPADLRVLIVDDDPEAALGLQLLIEDQGWEARLVTSGSEAIETAEEFRPHACLIDLGLPDITGYEVARRLRATPSGQSLILVAVSGFGHEAARKASGDAGFDDHLTKPARSDRVLELVSRALGDEPGEGNGDGGEGAGLPASRDERGDGAAAGDAPEADRPAEVERWDSSSGS